MSNPKRPKHGRPVPVAGFEAYIITRSAKVWSEHINRYRVSHINKRGYHVVTLTSSTGKSRSFRLHRLVAKAFNPNPNNYPEVHHRWHNKNDNRACALVWCDKKQNMQYRKEAGRIKRKNVPKEKKLPCKSSTTANSYALFKKTIGQIPEGRIFTGFFYNGKHYDTLNEISRVFNYSFTKVKRMFNLGKIVFTLDNEPQPLTEAQKKFIARLVAKEKSKPKRFQRKNYPINFNYYQNLCSQ